MSKPYQLARISSNDQYDGCLCLLSGTDMIVIDPNFFGNCFDGKEHALPRYSVIHESAVKDTLVAYGKNHFGLASDDYHISVMRQCLNAMTRTRLS